MVRVERERFEWINSTSEHRCNKLVLQKSPHFKSQTELRYEKHDKNFAPNK